MVENWESVGKGCVRVHLAGMRARSGFLPPLGRDAMANPLWSRSLISFPHKMRTRLAITANAFVLVKESHYSHSRCMGATSLEKHRISHLHLPPLEGDGGGMEFEKFQIL